jgi:hypothetical protein
MGLVVPRRPASIFLPACLIALSFFFPTNPQDYANQRIEYDDLFMVGFYIRAAVPAAAAGLGVTRMFLTHFLRNG